MGFSKISQTECGFDSEGNKWLLAGIAIRAPLKTIKTKHRGVKASEDDYDEEEEEEATSTTTPTAKEARIPGRFPCPPAPRKRKPSSRCNFNGAREFFTPPDLEAVFKRQVENAN